MIRNCQWNCMFFLAYYKHFFLISCFHDQRSQFYSITSLCLIVIKVVFEKCEKNISSEKQAKLRNYISKTKEMDQIVLQKGLFASIKEQLDNPKEQVEV